MVLNTAGDGVGGRDRSPLRWQSPPVHSTEGLLNPERDDLNAATALMPPFYMSIGVRSRV
jgi:hypothetical protein